MRTLFGLPLVSWQNGIVMIIVFAVVVLALFLAVYTMITTGNNKEDK